MLENSFEKYIQLRESQNPKDKDSQKPTALQSKVELGADGSDYQPFTVSDDPNSEHYGKNKGLAPVVRAFKKGGNWGWSKDDSSGEDKPVKISGKKLYLTGGSVRDHLAGKTPRNMELATNASPDEVYHILTQNGFKYLPEEQEKSKGKNFWPKETDKKGRPYGFMIQVNDDVFELDLFRKTPRGNVKGDLEAGTQTDDAAGRDFTINAMAIGLSNDNGPNKELVDFYGGAHDLKDGRVRAIGDPVAKFKEDPSRLLRYVRMLHQYGDPSKVTDEDKGLVSKMAGKLGKLKPDQISGELERALGKDDTDARKYLAILRDFGMLDSLFPGKNLDKDLPKELTELGDKHMPVAWMLRGNNPDDLEDTPLPEGMKKKVRALLKSLSLGPDTDEDSLEDILNSYRESGISGRKLKAWLTKLGQKDGSIADAFLQHAQAPRVKMLAGGDVPTEAFKDLYDPFSKQIVDHEAAQYRRKHLELENFRKLLKSS